MRCGSGNNVSTRIGICTRYDRNEYSYVATILADWLEQRGFDVSLLVVPRGKPVPQGVSWDTRQHSGSRVLFTDWCQHRDVVIWTVLPQPAQLQYLRTHKIKSYVLYDPWEEKTPARLQAYHNADQVLAINRSCGERCAADNKIPRFVYLPLVPNTPDYKYKPSTAGRPVTIVWPIYDGDWRRFDCMDMRMSLSRFLKTTDGAYELRVVISSSDIPSTTIHDMLRWSRKYPFVTVQTCNSVLWRELHYHDADVMFWPSTVENAMLRGLHAYSHGLSIIGLMANPMSELLAVNPHLAVGVPRSECDRHGYPVLVSSDTIHKAMLSRVLGVVQSPSILVEANANVSRFMSARRRMFSKTMTDLFS